MWSLCDAKARQRVSKYQMLHMRTEGKRSQCNISSKGPLWLALDRLPDLLAREG